VCKKADVEKSLPLMAVTIRYRRAMYGERCMMTVLATSAANAREAVRESEASRGFHAIIDGDAEAYDGPRVSYEHAAE